MCQITILTFREALLPYARIKKSESLAPVRDESEGRSWLSCALDDSARWPNASPESGMFQSLQKLQNSPPPPRHTSGSYSVRPERVCRNR